MCVSVSLPAAGSRFALLWSLGLHGKVKAASSSVDGTLAAIASEADDKYPLERFGDGRTSIGESPHIIGELFRVFVSYSIDESSWQPHDYGSRWLFSIGYFNWLVYTTHNANTVQNMFQRCMMLARMKKRMHSTLFVFMNYIKLR